MLSPVLRIFKMQGRVLPLEDGKELMQRAAYNFLSLKVLKFFVLFLVLGAGFSTISMYMTRYFDAWGITLQGPDRFDPCSDQGNGSGSWIRPSSSLMHTMSDEELLLSASFVPQETKCPSKRVPKVAFMFLTKGPLPLSPLWENFFKGNEGLYSTYIHSLPTYKADYQPTSVFYRRQIPSQVSEWGKMSMCDAERRLLANALLDPLNEWFILLSESCIPLYNFSIVYHYLMRSKYSYVGAFDDPGPHGRGRYNWNMLPEVNITQWRKGAQWFEVNRKLAVSIITDTKYYPKFKEFCKPACYVDEHYFPTMLTVESPGLIANRSVTWVDWSRGGAHPATFGEPDITEEFVKKILEGNICLYNGQPSSICFLFARKFAPNTLEPLLQLAPKLLGFG